LVKPELFHSPELRANCSLPGKVISVILKNDLHVGIFSKLKGFFLLLTSRDLILVPGFFSCRFIESGTSELHLVWSFKKLPDKNTKLQEHY
jgi:hypothetical protein